MVAHLPSKQMVAGSSPVSRSTYSQKRMDKIHPFLLSSPVTEQPQDSQRDLDLLLLLSDHTLPV
jgi:hypothetical protein